MTQVRSVPSPTAGRKPTADLRRFSRRALAVLLPIGPAAVALQRYVVPYQTTDRPDVVVARVSADLKAQSLLLWLAFLGLFTLVPGVLAVARLTRRRAPHTTLAAVLLLVPGYLSMGWLVGSDTLLWVGLRARVDQPILVRLYTGDHPTSLIAAALFVLGHVVGTVLIGVALWRSAAVPRWAAVLTVVAQPLHFTAAVVLGSTTLDVAAWGLNVIGYAVAGLAVLRLPDDEWDLPPVSSAAAPQTTGDPAAILRP